MQAELRAGPTKFVGTSKELSLALVDIQRLRDHVLHKADQMVQVSSCRFNHKTWAPIYWHRTGNYSLSSQIHSDIQSYTQMIKTFQPNQAIAALFMWFISSSGRSLNYCLAFALRQSNCILLASPEIKSLYNASNDVGMHTSAVGDPQEASRNTKGMVQG